MFGNVVDRIFKAHRKIKEFERKTEEYLALNGATKWKAERIKAKRLKLFKEKYKHETDYILQNNHTGLYMGVGVNLETLKLSPILLPWGDVSNHMITYGTTRMGKSYLMLSIVRQNILHGDDVTIFEPKGGIGQQVFNKVVEFAQEANRLQDLMFINPLMPNASEFFNPIYGLGDDEISSMIASILYPDAKGDSQFYSSHTFSTLKAVLYALTFLEKASDVDGTYVAEKEKKEYMKYLKIKEFKNNEIQFHDKESGLILPDIADRIFSKIENFEEDKKVIFNRSFITFKDIFYYIDAENLKVLKATVEKMSIENTNTHFWHLSKMKEEAISLLDKVFKIPEEHHSKISVSLSNFLADISTGLMGQIFCTIRINPILLRLNNPNRGMILLVQPVPLKIKKVSEYFNKIYIKMLESIYGNVSLSGRALSPRRHYAHLDEGESALYPGVESILNKGAGLLLTLNIYTQSLADLQAKLGTTIAQISQDSLNTYVILRMNDPKSIAEIIDAFGDNNFTETNIVGGEGGARISFSRTTKNILTKESIRKLRVGEGFLKNKSKEYKVAFPIMLDVDEKHTIQADMSEQEKNLQRLMNFERSLEKELAQ
ncbi:hypothetical protein BKH46_08035 [Helicobacter sp. 12S02634-8]|uniref:type IV secretory system conjugative DNA transfer family protein n=1 Tax=Helicobacter sp. 12S02634-8 TaxID=1476199 RepID=UPI000BA66B1A|nr:TraM recognition domain-containing protein [Helicobacter sp. 12S02634-8]PAF46326.1 hypothetical protein BKH46_08035 [Helicobacter sp. 12S02634-8]